MYKFGAKSLAKLNDKQVHPKIKQLMLEAIKTSPMDFTILETVRSEKTQQIYYKRGATRTMKSRHIPSSNLSGFCEAVDIAPFPIDWKNIQAFKNLAEHIKSVAKKLGIEINWGGDWRTFKDYPHFELKR